MCIFLHSEKKKNSASKTGSFSVNSNVERHLRGSFRFKVLIVITGQVLIYCCVCFSSVWQRLLSGNWSWVCEKLCEDRVYTFLWSTRCEAHRHWVWIINSYTGWGHAMFHFRYVPIFRKKQQSPKLHYLAHKLHGVRSRKTFPWYLQILFETFFNQ